MAKIDREDVVNALHGLTELLLEMSDAKFSDFMEGRSLAARMFVPQWDFISLDTSPIQPKTEPELESITLRLRVE